MLQEQSLMARIAIGKIAGFAIGLIGFLALPILAPGCRSIVALGHSALVRHNGEA